MSRGPLELLREVLAVLERSMPTPLELPGETNEHPIRVADRIHDYREAIAQVEALVKDWPDTYAAFKGAFDTPVAWKRIGGEYADDARQRLRQFDEAFKPFTPGQDSEGGGNGL